MITTKDRIAYIRRAIVNDVPQFKLITAKIKRVNICKNKTSVYSDRFNSLDLAELESNTEIINLSKGLLLVNEPFIISKEEDIKYLEAVCDCWNKNPPKSIFN